MTARRLALAWSWGALTGLTVGWVYGAATRAVLDFRALKTAARRSDGLAASRAPEGPLAQIGPQEGAQPRWVDLFGIDPDYTDGVPVGEFIERNRAGHDLIPAQRDTGHGPPPWPLPTGDTCPVTLGTLTCPFTGRHTVHAFQSRTWAPDRKADADQEVE